MQPVERFLPGGVNLENMSSHRPIDTDKTILNRINKVGLGQQGRKKVHSSQLCHVYQLHCKTLAIP